MNTYSVLFHNVNDCRTVIEGVNYKTALELYNDTKNHRRFFQDDLTIAEKNSGLVQLYRDNCKGDDVLLFESSCKKVKE